MKMKSIFMSMVAVAALASCSKESDLTANTHPDPGADSDKAYMSISVALPSAQGTRAIVTEDGTAEESKVSSVVILGFDARNNKVKDGTYYAKEVVDNRVMIVTVSSAVKKIFVVANPSEELYKEEGTGDTKIKSGKLCDINSFSELQSADIKEEIGSLTAENEFLMTSEGLQEAIIFPHPADAMNPDNLTKVKVFRAVSKVRFTTSPSLKVPDGVTASVNGYLLNTTNTVYYPLSAPVLYPIAAGFGTYRRDPNWTALKMEVTKSQVTGLDSLITGDAVTAFNWLDNNATHTWIKSGKSEYCLENTMEAIAQDYNNTTKVVINGTYCPKGVEVGDSWFRYDGTIMTFAELQAEYTKLMLQAGNFESVQEGITAAIAAFDSFAVKLLGEGKKFGDEDCTLESIDAVKNGGYLAATAYPCMIEYFQKSVCYYDVNILHDQSVLKMQLGRWGVVRNDLYLFNVTGISKPGLPYIPDPTDPDINDPSNPDPEDPTQDDDSDVYVNVEITSEPWVVKTQDEEL